MGGKWVFVSDSDRNGGCGQAVGFLSGIGLFVYFVGPQTIGIVLMVLLALFFLSWMTRPSG